MTIRAKRKGSPEPEEFQIKTPWGTISFRVFLVLCIGSMTPFGQWTLQKMGMQTPVADIESIKIDTAANKNKLVDLDHKVSLLVVEMERLRMNRTRTAANP